MNDHRPFENDKPLRKVLREWRVDASLPPHFEEKVWKRIESTEKQQRALWKITWNWLAAVLERPAFAAFWLAILLAIGASTGYVHGQSRTTQVKLVMQARYVQMIDPYQAHR